MSSELETLLRQHAAERIESIGRDSDEAVIDASGLAQSAAVSVGYSAEQVSQLLVAEGLNHELELRRDEVRQLEKSAESQIEGVISDDQNTSLNK